MNWNPETANELITEDEILTLAGALIKGQGSATEDEILKFINWAQEVRVGQTMLLWCLKGRAIATIGDDGEPLFELSNEYRRVLDDEIIKKLENLWGAGENDAK